MDPYMIKKDFPVLKDETLVYLDTAASSLKPKAVIDAQADYYNKYGVNVHRGVYQLSYIATQKYNEARSKVASFINGTYEEIIFTKGASSALNLVASSYGLNRIEKGDEIVTSELEHHSSLLPWQNIAKIKGATLKYIPLDKDGRITVEAAKKTITNKTKVVALTHVSNVMGYLTPLKQIIDYAHEKGAVVTVDAAQSAPHMRIDVKALDCDFLSFSSHKMFGPTGIGILYGKKALLNDMPPIEFGGDMIDYVEKQSATYKEAPYKFETGTPPIAEAIGLGAAIDYIEAIGMEDIHNHEIKLKEYTVNLMKQIDGVEIYNETSETGIISFNIKGVHPHDAVTFFDGDNIAMRAGHHCAQLVIKWLDVLATLRISFYVYNTKEDCDRFIESLTNAVTFFKSVGF
jgi:cysteine desulfurase/selenocysteine lyase